MSTNHYSTDLPEAQNWWTKNQNIMDPSRNQNTNNTTFYTQNTSFTFNLNHEDEELEVDDQQQFSTTNETMEKDFDEHQESNQEIIIPKESLFEKPLTPSDVGKLNRLVIPKQHAEKYFPLSSNTNDSVEKGLLLGFEDESGKPWKFRYSYWNSSQSYVLTKGWSRFVKEKRLDAGDIVLFQRHQHDGERFFIGWRRKGSTPVIQPPAQLATVVNGDTSGWTPLFNSGHPYPSHASQLPYHQPDYIHAGSGVTVAAAVQNQTTTRTSGFPKRLRLFGVNLECQPQHYSHFDPSTLDPNPNPNSHMDTNFSRDVNYQMRYRHG